MNLDFLIPFTNFFQFCIPLGVCLCGISVFYYLFYKVQNERRQDYIVTSKQQRETIEVLKNLLNDREKRIRQLEEMLNNDYLAHQQKARR